MNVLTPTKIYLVLLFVTFVTTVHAQSLNTNWNADLNNALKQFLACEGASQERTECTHFIGESLNIVYKVDDFKKSGKYMSTNEIAGFLKSNSKWKSLGPAYDQTVLTKAQEFANAKKAVVAVFRNAEGVGHVALVTPGELQISGSWGLKVPNAASFFQKDPSKSFVGKGLSFAFSRVMMKDIILYVRE